MDKKYELIPEENGLFRVKALKDFITRYGKPVHKGELGALVEGEHNLSQEGNCWMGYNVELRGNTKVI